MKQKILRLIRHKFSLLALLASSSLLNAATTVSNDITSNTTWSKAGSPYILTDYIFVKSGFTLTIDAGVLVQANQGSADGAPALIVTQGAKIDAQGTANEPIIFTSILDDGSLTKADKGLWGGLIILGKAPINSNGKSNADNTPLTNQIEGVPDKSAISGRDLTANGSADYGGTDENDNSGTLKYISIRHGGAEIGAGNEINGLTLGGVGAGTTIEYVDVFANKDDGIEFFGGTVSAKYLSVCYVGDDSFDFDEGYNGYLQFLVSIQDENSNRAFEWDGSTESDDRKADTSTLPDYTNAIISNATAIGAGKDVTSKHEDNNVGLEIRDNGAGNVWNSIFTEFSKSIMDLENSYKDPVTGDIKEKGSVSTSDTTIWGSQALLQNGILAFAGNLFWNGGKGNTALGTAEDDQVVADVIGQTSFSNSFDVDPLIIDDNSSDGVVNPVPSSSSPAATGAASISSALLAGLTQTTYRGAFDPSGTNWMYGWTKLGELGTPAVKNSSAFLGTDIMNISTSGFVKTDAKMAAGFIISGTESRKVLVTGKMSKETGVDVLNNPKLTVQPLARDSISGSNTDWSTSSDKADIEATGFMANSPDTDSAVILTLAPGAYVADVETEDSDEGQALVEVFDLDLINSL